METQVLPSAEIQELPNDRWSAVPTVSPDDADEIVTAARREADEMLAEAAIAVNRMLTEAQATADELVATARDRCQLGGVCASLGQVQVSNIDDAAEQAEQSAFDTFFTADRGKNSRRDWMRSD